MVSLTPKAANHVKTMMARYQLPEGSALRFLVKYWGCSGYSYVLDFEKCPNPDVDSVYEILGVRCVVDKKSEQLLEGTVLDYQDGLRGQGFVWNNPQAKSSCGCGSSFS